MAAPDIVKSTCLVPKVSDMCSFESKDQRDLFVVGKVWMLSEDLLMRE